MAIIKTEFGSYCKDQSGLFHYNNKESETVYDAIKDALKHYSQAPSYFWFNGTFCPILPDDTENKLAERWYIWRSEYQENPNKLLAMIEEFSKNC